MLAHSFLILWLLKQHPMHVCIGMHVTPCPLHHTNIISPGAFDCSKTTLHVLLWPLQVLDGLQ